MGEGQRPFSLLKKFVPSHGRLVHALSLFHVRRDLICVTPAVTGISLLQ